MVNKSLISFAISLSLNKVRQPFPPKKDHIQKKQFWASLDDTRKVYCHLAQPSIIFQFCTFLQLKTSSVKV